MNGLVLMFVLVAAGMGITSIYYNWKAPAIVSPPAAAPATVVTAAASRSVRRSNTAWPPVSGSPVTTTRRA